MQENLKVMIVDDEPINLDILHEMLSDKCDTHLVGSGEEALTHIPSFNPDLVLLDVMMPGINGYETCRKIRTEYDNSVKIIMISAKSGAEDIKMGLEAGADEYIPKPFDEDALIETINRFV